MNIDIDIQKYMSMTGAYNWSKAVIRQGERLLREHEEIHAKLRNQLDRNKLVDEQDSWAELNYIIYMEQFFFVTALGRVIKFMESENNEGAYSDINDIIEERIGKQTIVDMRNMNMHDLDYFRGKGNFQERFHHTDNGGTADATSTVVTQRGYMLGNRLCVEEVITLFKELLPSIKEISNFY